MAGHIPELPPRCNLACQPVRPAGDSICDFASAKAPAKTPPMKRHPLIAFLVLTVLISWALWIPMEVMARRPNTSFTLLALLQIWGGLGPGLAVVIVTWKVSEGGGLRTLLGRFLIWRVRFFWYLVALFLPAVISLVATVLYTMFAGDAPDFTKLPFRSQELWSTPPDYRLWMIVASLVLELFGAEMGWRGFVLPRLQQRFDALVSSLILAAFWALWLLPLSFAEMGGWALLIQVFGLIPGSIMLTWLFNNAQGSLLLIVLFNAGFKVTSLLLAAPDANSKAVLSSYWFVAIAIVAWAGAARLSRQPLHDNCRAASANPTSAVPVPEV
jgi:membrane protease YdiL (CAAX protease family)